MPAYQFNLAAVTDQIRNLMKNSYVIPDGNSITLSGEEVQPINQLQLPIGLIELEGAEELKNQPALQDLTVTFQVYCWMVRQTDSGADDISVLRGYLRSMGRALMIDKRLNSTASYLKVKGFNWSGIGRDWPVEFQSGLQAGYVCAEIQISI